MSREIKFRAWDIHCQHMLDHSDLIDVVDGGGSVIQMILDESIECHLMQYTGLKDRNGVEIYEGDIVSFAGEECSYPEVVTYQAPSFVIKRKEHLKTWREFIIAPTENQLEEVIGNIHENPDLLK